MGGRAAVGGAARSGAALTGADLPGDGWPAWATETVEIVDYDPAWPARAGELCAQVSAAIGGPVEHVGSTAVPGLAAKPVIDLMAATGVVDDAAGAHAAAALGWALVPPELDARPYRRLLVLVAGGHRAAHLHLIDPAHPRWAEQLVFRDALRADAVLAGRYAALKRRLADEAGDREAYTAAKGAFIRGVLRSVAGGDAGRHGDGDANGDSDGDGQRS